MEFRLSIEIDQPVSRVFEFLRDIHLHPQEEGSKVLVLVLDKITTGPVGLGTRFREVVQMLPWHQGEIISEVTLIEENKFLELTFHGGWMEGVLLYSFIDHSGGTTLKQHEYFYVLGALKIFSPLIKRILGRKLISRLVEIKNYLEANSQKPPAQ